MAKTEKLKRYKRAIQNLEDVGGEEFEIEVTHYCRAFLKIWIERLGFSGNFFVDFTKESSFLRTERNNGSSLSFEISQLEEMYLCDILDLYIQNGCLLAARGAYYEQEGVKEEKEIDRIAMGMIKELLKNE